MVIINGLADYPPLSEKSTDFSDCELARLPSFYFCFLMNSGLAAVFTIFFQLNLIRRILNVLTRNIVESIALAALEPNLWSIAFLSHILPLVSRPVISNQ